MVGKDLRKLPSDEEGRTSAEASACDADVMANVWLEEP